MNELRKRTTNTSPKLPEKRQPYEKEEKLHSRTRVVQTLPQGSYLVCLLLTAIALWTRLYKINWADFVVWYDVADFISRDEAHFGKFAGHYIKGTFYFDVHPPLGKMINAFAGLLGGFNGHYEFPSGEKYPDEVKYGVIRFFNGVFGAMVTPLAYWTGIHLRLSHFAAILLAVMTITGLFLIALVGLHTVEDLWEIYGDKKLSLRDQLIHLGSRVICLICVPILVYMLSFALHFAILNNSGPGDAQMSSLFQAGLNGNDFSSNPLELAYGSKISIKNNARGGGLLHSHVQRFPGGSEQQQVTTYGHKDSNNEWIVEKAWGNAVRNESDPIEFVKHGDIIRLVHEQTGKNLHSHRVKAPITESENEVSGYGSRTSGDSNDNWDFAEAKGDTIRSLTTRFRLVHANLGCVLRANGVTLPEWGFKQIEVTCQDRADLYAGPNIWNIELHVNSRLEPGGKNTYKSTFLRDFVDLNVAMWSSNNALTPDPDKEPAQLESQPYHWPFMLRGIRMCGWGDNDIKYYMMGNPLIWWGSTIALVLLSFGVLVFLIRIARGFHDFNDNQWSDFTFGAKVGLLGWFLHYIPFYIMGRVMYLHHYFPALYFAIISFVVLVDQYSQRVSKMFANIVMVSLMVVFTASFLFFADMAFGMQGPAIDWASRQWLSSWNIY
ncbi:Protein O-mannosyltransferase 2 [Globomyces sp. JEL0801]|nr:Protein O-mannosyltransferase 2 [Globomyces sp. JEL0801]